MAKFVDSTSHTFDEYLLIPRHTNRECMPSNVSLQAPLVKFKRGKKPELSMNIPMVSAIMQAVSGDKIGYGGIEKPLKGGKGYTTKMEDGTILTYRPISSSDGSPAVEINIKGSDSHGKLKSQKIHFTEAKQWK